MEATLQESSVTQESQSDWEDHRDDQLSARESVASVVDEFGAAFALQALADAIHRQACITVSAQGDRLIQVAHILHDLSGLMEQGDASE